MLPLRLYITVVFVSNNDAHDIDVVPELVKHGPSFNTFNTSATIYALVCSRRCQKTHSRLFEGMVLDGHL